MNNYFNPFNKICEEFAKKFDSAFETKDWNETLSLINQAKLALVNDSIEYTPLIYSIGTSYGDLAVAFSKHSEQVPDSVTKKDNILDPYGFIQLEIYYLRKALKNFDDEILKSELLNGNPFAVGLYAVLCTNLANAYDFCGRKSLAIKHYSMAMKICPDFPMAEGNLGSALLYYSMVVHDPAHRDYLNYYAYRYLSNAIKSEKLDSNALKIFKHNLGMYEAEYVEGFLKKSLDIPQYSMGDKHEHMYRNWCLENHFFLNPLNDLLDTESCFAADVLQIPTITTSYEQVEHPAIFSMFNQIKQEFVYARYLLYSSTNSSGDVHFADKDTYLVDTMDFTQYSIRVESCKTAFRLLYSLLDKTAYLINDYWNLGIEECKVNINAIWNSKLTKNESLHPENNIGLRGMRWVYDDFKIKFGDSSLPENKHLNTLRNAFEHKFVKIHADFAGNSTFQNSIGNDGLYHINEHELYEWTISLLEIVREWIIELVIAIKTEEYQRKAKRQNDKETPALTMPINLMTFEDEWKI